MPCEIRNPNPDPITLPHPLRGTLHGGQALTFRFERAQLERAIPHIERSFRVSDTTHRGPYDGRFVTGELAAFQPEWHVNFDTGDDLADGSTASLAIKTLDELFRRLPEGTEFKNDVDIYLYGDNNPTDPWSTRWKTNVPTSLPVVFIYPAAPGYTLRQVRVHTMSAKAYYSGAMTSVQTMDPPTNRPYVISDLNAKGVNQTPPIAPPSDQVFWYNSTIDWFGRVRATNHGEQRARITTGPRAGAVAWLNPGNLGALFGGGNDSHIRTSNWAVSIPFGYTPDFVTVGVTAVVPQVGDAYVIERLPLLYVDKIHAQGNSDNGGSGIAFNGFNMRLVNGGDSQNPSTQPPIVQDGGSIVFTECTFDFVIQTLGTGAGGSFIYFLNCNGIDGIAAAGPGFVFVDAGNYHLSLNASMSAVLELDADVFVETGTINASGGGQVWINTAQVHDQPGHGIKAGVVAAGGTLAGGTVYFFSAGFYGNSRLWGQDQTGTRKYGIAAWDGGRFFWDSTMSGATLAARITIAGVVKDFNIGLSHLNGDQAVSVDPTTKLPTALRACTYDNLFNKTIGQGGFGLRAVDFETGSLIAPFTDPT